MAEYGLTLALIAVASISALTLLGGSISGLLQNISGTLGAQVAAAPSSPPAAAGPASGGGNTGTPLEEPVASPVNTSTSPLNSGISTTPVTDLGTNETQTVVTAGSLGTKDQIYQYASRIEQVANKIISNPYFNDPTFRNMILDLAKQGRTVGDTVTDPAAGEMNYQQYEALKTKVLDYLEAYPYALSAESTQELLSTTAWISDNANPAGNQTAVNP